MKYKIEYGVNEKDRTLSVGLRSERFDDCSFVIDQYSVGGGCCLSIESPSEGMVARLTTNLPKYKIGRTEAFVDENNCPGAKGFLVENGFAEDLNRTGKSGHCEYPLVRLKLWKIFDYSLWKDRWPKKWAR